MTNLYIIIYCNGFKTSLAFYEGVSLHFENLGKSIWRLSIVVEKRHCACAKVCGARRRGRRGGDR